MTLQQRATILWGRLLNSRLQYEPQLFDDLVYFLQEMSGAAPSLPASKADTPTAQSTPTTSPTVVVRLGPCDKVEVSRNHDGMLVWAFSPAVKMEE